MTQRKPLMAQILLTVFMALLLCLAGASTAAGADLAQVEIVANQLSLDSFVDYDSVRVTVTGPDGFVSIQDFGANERPSVELPALDGLYKYEFRFAPVLSDREREELAAARAENRRPVGIDRESWGNRVEWGTFSIAGGALVEAGLEDDTKGSSLDKATVLTTNDGVVYNSLCVGFDCPTSPTFSDSTILMMENNTRIKFGDTSNSPFPNNDWEIEANSNLSGGQSYLGFNDCGTGSNQGGCATDLVFAVEAGTRQNALRVESDGDVGFGTANPVVNLHVVDGNSPTLRLEQDTSSGFAAQTWDLAGNETNFFVRDATNGSQLPFRIRPGADSNSIYIENDNNVGFGTTAADERIHVVGTDNPRILIQDTTDNSNDKPGLALDSPAAASNGLWLFEVDNAGNFQIDFGPSTGPEIVISDSTATNGTVTINGNLMVNGTCTGCDAVFSPEYPIESVEEHAEFMYTNNYLPAVGPTPEGNGLIDVFAKTTGILQEVEKAHIYIEQLHRTVQEKNGELTELKDRVAQLEALIEKLSESQQ